MAVVKTFLVTVIFALIYENKSESVPWTNQQEWLEHTKKGVRFLIPELCTYVHLLDKQNLGSIKSRKQFMMSSIFWLVFWKIEDTKKSF